MNTHQPLRPYLFRAYYDWMVANQLTPYLVVKAPYPGVKVPLDAAKDGKIVLNVSPQAVVEWKMTTEQVCFNACFHGVPQEIVVPMAAMAGIYARENGAGTLFAEEPSYQKEQTQQVTVMPGMADAEVKQPITLSEPAKPTRLRIIK
ncbi:MAG: ClpXP protease specificity-enhancing factor [Candidatus Symbiodolus clandestinus]